MKDWYRQLKLEYKIVVWSLIVLAGIILVLIPLFFFSLMEVPQGIALGAGVGIITYLFLGLFNNSDSPKKSLVLTVITIIIRFLVIAGILVLVGWLYYAKGVKAFNIFASRLSVGFVSYSSKSISPRNNTLKWNPGSYPAW